MKEHKIGIIPDTHGLLRLEISNIITDKKVILWEVKIIFQSDRQLLSMNKIILKEAKNIERLNNL